LRTGRQALAEFRNPNQIPLPHKRLPGKDELSCASAHRLLTGPAYKGDMGCRGT